MASDATATPQSEKPGDDKSKQIATSYVTIKQALLRVRYLLDSVDTAVAIDLLDNLIDSADVDKPWLAEDIWTRLCKTVLKRAKNIGAGGRQDEQLVCSPTTVERPVFCSSPKPSFHHLSEKLQKIRGERALQNLALMSREITPEDDFDSGRDHRAEWRDNLNRWHQETQPPMPSSQGSRHSSVQRRRSSNEGPAAAQHQAVAKTHNVLPPCDVDSARRMKASQGQSFNKGAIRSRASSERPKSDSQLEEVSQESTNTPPPAPSSAQLALAAEIERGTLVPHRPDGDAGKGRSHWNLQRYKQDVATRKCHRTDSQERPAFHIMPEAPAEPRSVAAGRVPQLSARPCAQEPLVQPASKSSEKIAARSSRARPAEPSFLD
eukprot:TRINITY_DN28282_c1_g3_i1.p1 TRINITY_DN28282_c1_g3~~TRINITY_DN28282_c1_g3_i1.p1  ORF type:complete len:378 (+),score=67.70 TRINITY_DN28282_c1_g3_i1:135-1268(+)